MGQGAGGTRRTGPARAPDGLRSDTATNPGAELARQVLAYDPRADGGLIEAAYALAAEAHAPQKREDGQPYIVHPLAVAGILADYRLDAATVATALLHDTVEDAGVTLAELEKRFGKEIARLVDGVTKLTRLELQSERTKQAENFRKLVLAMSEDIRVLIVKLADRLHNMRTLAAIPKPEKRVRTARETLEIYAPLAERIGMDALKTEIETLSFREMNPDAWQTIAARLTYLRGQGADLIEEIEQDVRRVLRDAGVDAIEVQGREKSPYSIWLKMQRKNVAFEQLSDIMAFRVIVADKGDCYAALGAIHSAYRVVPGRFKDWISTPKTNGYQSIHTGVTVPERRNAKIEVQIRTREMHEVAEYGVAAHWVYKQGEGTAATRKRYPWVRDLLEILESAADPQDFLDHTKLELHRDQVFCFTPKGDLIELPRVATPVDFAYQAHSQVGDNTVGAKVNGKMVPFDYKLQNADVVEIVTSKNGTPSLDWLRICGSNQARNKIRAWFRKERREENVQRGRDILRRELAKQRMDGVLNDEPVMDTVARALNFEKGEDLLASIGFGETSLAQFLGRLREELPKETVQTLLPQARKGGSKRKSSQPIRVKGIENILIRFSKCCAPVPGDQVVGYITLGKGVSVHVRECPNLANLLQTSPERLIEVEWDAPADAGNYHVDLEIDAWDRNGLLSVVMSVLNDARIPTRSCKAWAKKDRAFIKMGVDILHKRQLDDLIKKLSRIRDVISVSRMHSNP